MKNRKYINGPLTEELGDLDIKVKEEIEKESIKQKEEKMKAESKEIADTLTDMEESEDNE